MEGNKIHIDISQIPPIQSQLLGATFFAAVKRFYSDPENVKKCEEWKKERDEDATRHKPRME